MTLREQIQAQIDAHKAQIAMLEQHLAAAGTWLEEEVSIAKAHAEALFEYLKSRI